MVSLKIALIGYGKMGHEIEAIAVERGHEIVLKVSGKNASIFSSADLKSCDVAIEFSRPETVIQNIKTCFDANVPVVVGTTGWQMRLDEVRNMCISKNQALLYSSNFSIGVNIFFELNKKLAAIMKSHPSYAVEIEEIHHIHKLDKPSGTAISIAQQILEANPSKIKWVIDKDNPLPAELNIVTKRQESVIGIHDIKYQSATDKIVLHHEAFTRKGFAEGALLAAQWIIGKKGIFTMNDMLNF